MYDIRQGHFRAETLINISPGLVNRLKHHLIVEVSHFDPQRASAPLAGRRDFGFSVWMDEVARLWDGSVAVRSAFKPWRIEIFGGTPKSDVGQSASLLVSESEQLQPQTCGI